MIGVIQNILMKLVEEKFGPNAVKEILKKTNLPSDFTFRIDTFYSDKEFITLFQNCCEAANWSEQEACDEYAVIFLREAKILFPHFFAMSKTSKEFLLRQPAIHNSLGAGLRDKKVRQNIADKFHIEEIDGVLYTHYNSPNQLCTLYISLANQLIKEYGEEGQVSSVSCARNGDTECIIRTSWESKQN